MVFVVVVAMQMAELNSLSHKQSPGHVLLRVDHAAWMAAFSQSCMLEVYLKILLKVVALPTSQRSSPRPVNFVAPKKAFSKLATCEVFQLPRSASKFT